MTANGKPFQPGQSGNPRGRPRLTEEQRLASVAINGPLTTQAIEVLRTVMQEGGSEALRAAMNVLERSLGKPAMATEDREAFTAPRMDITKLSDEDLARLHAITKLCHVDS